MTTTSTPKVHVVLKRPRPVTALIALAQAIEAAMGANVKTFPSPTPTIPQFTSDIATLVSAEALARTRAKGAVQTRDAKMAIVVTDLTQLRTYVEGVCDANPGIAAAIANSAGMELRKAPARSKNDVNVKPSKIASGTVSVTARVGTKQKQSHEWEYSIDAGKTWIACPPTTQAKTTITGLTPGLTVLVRHRAVTGTGPTSWCDPASLIVI